jgi:hypothetical protein
MATKQLPPFSISTATKGDWLANTPELWELIGALQAFLVDQQFDTFPRKSAFPKTPRFQP